MVEFQLVYAFLLLLRLLLGQLVENPHVDTSDSLITLNTTSGLFQGRQVSVRNIVIGQFLGIPYGEKPARFQRSQLKTFSSGSISSRTICPQRPSTEEQDEDCLTLNLFVPRTHVADDDKAILLYLHAGWNQVGSGAQFDGSALAALGDVIVMTLNSRLNLFGYLQSNEGLYDQLGALEWILNNAQTLRGDPKRITVFGQSTGAVNALLLAMSTRSKGSIRRVISESGTPFHPWAIDRQPWRSVEQVFLRHGLKTAKKFYHSNVEYLKTLPLSEIRYPDHSTWNPSNNYPYPKVDGDWIPEQLENSIRSGPLKHVDLLIGTTSAEWSYLTEQYSSADMRSFRTLFEQLYPNHSCLFDEIQRRYSLNDLSAFNSNVITQNYRTLVSDLLFYYDLIRFLHQRLTSEISGTTYVYSLNNPSVMRPLSTLDLLQGRSLRSSSSDKEIQLSVQLIRYWANFIKTGDPNLPSSPVSPFWPPYNASEKLFLNIHLDQIRVEKNFLEDTFQYWFLLFHRPVCVPFRWYHTTLLVGILILAFFLILLSIFHNTKRSRRNIKPIEMTTSEMFAHYQYLPSVVS